MDIGKQYDKAVNNLYDIGEMIFKTYWEKHTKIVKRQNKDSETGFTLNNIIPLMTGAGYAQEETKDISIPIYENVRVEAISPFMLVFHYSKYKIRDKKIMEQLH